jgi:acetolactate synthase small subunit
MQERFLMLSALVENHAGVLLRVCGLFARRGYNIQTPQCSETGKNSRIVEDDNRFGG